MSLHHAFQIAILAAGACLVLLTLPLLLEMFALSLAAILPSGHRAELDPTRPTLLHAVIPAHNEEGLITAAVRSLLEAEVPPARVLVVAHNCTDDTGARAQAAGAHVLTLNETSGGGKGVALLHGFRQSLASGASGILVLDADSRVSPSLTCLVGRALASGSRAVQCRYVVANAAQNPRTRLMSLAFYGINVLRPRGRSRLGLSCGIFGNGFALSRSALSRVPYTAHSVVEDLEYHLKLVSAGIRVDFLDDAEVWGEMPDNARAAASQRARWEGGRNLIRRQWRFPLLRLVLAGRLRLLDPLLDLLAPPAATYLLLLVALLLLPNLGFRLYAGLGFLTLALYIGVAAALSPEPWANLKALLFGFNLLQQKVLAFRSTRTASRTGAPWVRTERNESSAS